MDCATSFADGPAPSVHAAGALCGRRIRLMSIWLAVIALGSFSGIARCAAQNCIVLRGQAYGQNFDGLAQTGASNSSSTLPLGFSFVETGSMANTTYAADDGSTNISNTYSYGSVGDSDRALGELTGLGVRSFCGVCFLNNTGYTLTSLTVSYRGEQWRLGTADEVNDRLTFQYSKTATSPGDNNSQWLSVAALEFVSPASTGAGPKDGNHRNNRVDFDPTTIIPVGGIPNGTSFFFRWLPVDIANNDDGLAIDDFELSYSPSADFNLDGFINGKDVLAIQRGFGTTGAEMEDGDANGDGVVNAADFTILRSQFGAFTPGGGSALGSSLVPEPTGVGLVALALTILFVSWRVRCHRHMVLVWGIVSFVGLVESASAQTVSLSLNVFPSTNANPNAGGNWTLVAKTTAQHGISAIDAFITGIAPSSVAYPAGINAAVATGGVPYVIPGNPVELVYFQDFGQPNIVVGVGTTAFTSTADPLGDTAWNSATRIASGTYAGAMPVVLASSGDRETSANVFSTGTPPFTHADDADVTVVTRRALTGDYDQNGVVDGRDYVVWRNSAGLNTTLRNDPTPGVGNDDYTRWRANFGTSLPAGSSVASTAVPEPSTAILLLFAATSAYLRQRTSGGKA